MIYRFAKFAISVAFEILFGITVIAGIGLWHLSSGPLQLNFLTPYLESAFTHLPSGHTVSIEKTLLVWNPQSAAVELGARGLSIRDQNYVTYATFPAVTIKLSVRALARGLVAPATIELKGLQAQLRRSSAGTYQLATPEYAIPSDDEQAFAAPEFTARIRALMAKLAAALESEHDPSNPLFYFETFRLVNGEIAVTDDRIKDTWRIALPKVELRRKADGLTGDLHADITTAGHTTALQVSYSYGNTSTTSRAPRPAVVVNGVADDVRGATTVTVQATLSALAIDDIVRYWPAHIRPKARRWVMDNIRQGVVDEMTVDAELELPNPNNNGSPRIKRFSGAFGYSGVHVHYLRPVPPVTEVSGTAQFDQRALRFRIEEGISDDLELTTAQVDITGLDSASAEVDVRLGLYGSVPAALTLLGHPRFRLASRLGLDPAQTGGAAVVQTRLSFPLRSNLGVRDINVEVDAQLRNASLRSALLGHDMKHGVLTLSANNDGMRLRGSSEFAAIPLTLDLQYAFSRDTPWRKTIVVEIPRIGDAARERLGLKTKEFVEGPLSVGIVARIRHDGRGVVNADLDLNRTQLSIPFMQWNKSEGTPGKARIRLELVPDQRVDQARFNIEADRLEARGTAYFEETGDGVDRVDIARLRVGESQLSSVSIIPEEGRFSVSVGQGVLDARPFLERESRRERKSSSAFSLNARQLKKVYVGENRYFEDVDLRLDHTSTGWKSIKIYARVPRQTSPKRPLMEPASFVLGYGPSESNTYSLWINTNDAGSTLHTLGMLDGIQGGHLEIVGESASAPSGSSIRGSLSLEDYTLTNAPVMARLLTAASLAGIVNLLKGEGIAFDKLRADFVLNKKAINVQSMRTHGSSLGLTAEGDIDIDEGTIDMQGTLVPLYGINSALGKIPLIGELIVGGKGEGLVGVRYGIEGQTSRPVISVNPVSALTPGFLRNVFGLIETSNSR